MAGPHRVYLELGQRWVFACALDWPGWCRRAKGEDAAIDALDAYAPRYRAAVGSGFEGASLQVVGRVEGNATTDFGAPGAIGTWDDEPLAADELARQLAVLDATWRAFDAVVVSAPPVLRKGPRGGGRDRDQIADHVREAERAYAAKAGSRVAPRTAWDEQRRHLLALLGGDVAPAAWPRRYALRRLAWHVLDHAWEIEDRATAREEDG